MSKVGTIPDIPSSLKALKLAFPATADGPCLHACIRYARWAVQAAITIWYALSISGFPSTVLANRASL